jgi:RES domain-containing protein
VDEGDVLRRIDSLGIELWSGTAFRHTSPGRDPFSGEGARLFGGRWNSRDLASTIYLAFPRLACIREFERMASRQPGGVEAFRDRAIHEIGVRGARVLDVRTEDALNLVGLKPTDISSADMSNCQRVGDAAFYLGLQGVLAPSATAAGFVLALFEVHLTAGQLRVLSSVPLSSLEAE